MSCKRIKKERNIGRLRIVFVLMELQVIIGFVVWMFVSEIIGAMIVWLVVGETIILNLLIFLLRIEIEK